MRSRLLPILVCTVASIFAFDAAAPAASPTRSVRITGAAAAAAPGAAPIEGPPRFDLSEADNRAGVAIEILPTDMLELGSVISFRVSTRKPGYLVLVDVDSTGKLAQIYPNAISISEPDGAKDDANLIKPGRPITIPEKPDKSGLRFFTQLPAGLGMALAILSDKPIRFIDLPDVPAPLVGHRQAVEFLMAATKELKIIPAGNQGEMEDAHWSIASRFYIIR